MTFSVKYLVAAWLMTMNTKAQANDAAVAGVPPIKEALDRAHDGLLRGLAAANASGNRNCNPCYAIIIDSLTEFEEALTTFGTDYFFVLDVVGTAKFEAGRRGLAANAGGNKNCDTCYAEIKNDLEELAEVLLLFEERTIAIAAQAGSLGGWYKNLVVN